MNEETTLASDGRDYTKFVYFTSKASDCAIVYKPRVERVLDSGEKTIAKDEDGKEMTGHRIEFRNHNLTYEITDENKPMIDFLRGIILLEMDVPINKKLFIELMKPIKSIPENEVNSMLAAKDAEIKKLKEDAGEEVEDEKESNDDEV